MASNPNLGRPRSPRIQESVLDAAVELVLSKGFRAVTMDSIACAAGVGRMTVYRRWPNKAAIVMDAFVARVDADTLFPPARDYKDGIRRQMKTMAKAFRGRDGVLMRALLAESQFDPELAVALRERWTLPRRKMAIAHFERGISEGILRPGLTTDAMIDILYAPLYYRLQMGIGPLSDAYVDEIFDHAMKGLARF